MINANVKFLMCACLTVNGFFFVLLTRQNSMEAIGVSFRVSLAFESGRSVLGCSHYSGLYASICDIILDAK